MDVTAVAVAMMWIGTAPHVDSVDIAMPAISLSDVTNDEQGSAQTTAPAAPVEASPVQPTQKQAEPAQIESDSTVDKDILVTARRRSPIDPVEKVNVESYKAVQAFDKILIGPVSKGYKKGVPKPVRAGVHNFLDNVHEPIVFLNYLLQLKPGKAAETLARFTINSTAGIGGVFDIAKRKPFKLPHRPNSLADTLGYYGVEPGPYFFVPLIGPTSLRDLFGIIVDRSLIPVAVGKPFTSPEYTLTTDVLGSLDYRVASDERLTTLHTANDPYAATRDDYFRKRNAEIDRLHDAKWRARHALPVILPGAPSPSSTTDAPPPGLSVPVAPAQDGSAPTP
jgi:phospholipid-binding lipoprotein MlaA